LRASVPLRPFRGPDTVELVVWRGRFRYAGSRKIALVPDLSTRIHPELHSPGNVAEFEDYLGYALRRADAIATLSESSREDIVERLNVFPKSVHVIPTPLSPVFRQPLLSRGIASGHGLKAPYLLCVATTEPRKNLRRLVRAFERLSREEAPLLVLAGAAGWDEGFGRFLVESDAHPRVRNLGFVPLGHLPSLYHFASAVVYPSVYEGFGLPVLEAMCSSAVVVTARLRSLPEDLVAGLLDFAPYDTEGMASALRAALRLTADESAAYRRRCRSQAEALLEGWSQAPPLPGVCRPSTTEAGCASPS
jgi:alpha-1,3-rhamnosyl/mannosyltransferase